MSDKDEVITTESTPNTVGGGLPYTVKPGGKGQIAGVAVTPGATLNEKSSGAILEGMKRLEEEMNNPYQKFRSGLDTMLAHTGYNPSSRILADQQQNQQEQQNLYNLALQKAQVQAGLENSKALAGAFAPGQGGGGAGGTSPIDAAINALPESERAYGRYLAQTNLPELMKKVQAYELKKPDQVKMLETLKGMDPTPQNIAWARQNFPELTKVQKTITPEGTEKPYTPNIMELFKQPAPTTAPTPAGNIPDAEAWAKANNIPLSPNGGNRTNDQQWSQWLQNPNVAAVPGTSPHEGKRALDVPVRFQTPEVKAKLEAAGFEANVPGEAWHYVLKGSNAPLSNIPTTTSKAPLSNLPTGNIPSSVSADTSTQGVDLRYKNLAEAHKTFETEVYKPLAANIKANENEVMAADRVLEAIPKGERGPGTGIKQTYLASKMATGLPLTPEEEAFYMSNLDIEQVKKQDVALGAKAAMGSQYTGKESENFEKTLAGISNPNEFIKTTYQIRKAKALVDLAHEKYLRQFPDDKINAENNWDNTGIKEKIFRDTVDVFKNAHKIKETPKKDAGTSNRPSWAPEDAKIGTDANGKPGWFVTRGGKTYQVTE
jgi:hypothetical protein